jgi:hypothetical protein
MKAKMDKTSHTAGKLLHYTIVLATSIVAVTLLPQLTAAILNFPKDCFLTDDNGRKWPCSRSIDHAANRTWFRCPVENRLSAQIEFNCNDEVFDFIVGPGKTANQVYESVFDPAPPSYTTVVRQTKPKVTCEWRCAGNTMDDIVVWDEQWPEAWSCRTGGGDGQCRLVFESNREVVLVTRAGRRVLGDVAIKECSKNWGGYGRWLPLGLGCTYPRHDHEYYGTIGWLAAGRGRL